MHGSGLTRNARARRSICASRTFYTFDNLRSIAVKTGYIRQSGQPLEKVVQVRSRNDLRLVLFFISESGHGVFGTPFRDS